MTEHEIIALKVGDFEGDRCNRVSESGVVCDGTMDYREVEDCRCHLYAPCNACVENPVVCDICGASEHDE